MGAPIARHIAAAGIETRVWNRTRERAEALSGDVASVADSPAEAAAGADAVIAMLADAGAVRAVMVEGEGALEAMDADATWIQMSTIGIAATEEMAALAEERGVAFVDAPVVGTRQPAEEGQLTVLASGPEESRERCSPVFEAVGSKVIWLGAAGAGNRMKLVFNNWVLTLTVGLAETFAVAEALGIDPDAFLDGIRGGPMGVAYADLKGKMILEREFEPSFPLYLAAK